MITHDGLDIDSDMDIDCEMELHNDMEIDDVMVYIDLDIEIEVEINNGNFEDISVSEILKESSLSSTLGVDLKPPRMMRRIWFCACSNLSSFDFVVVVRMIDPKS